jgi:hypothetical protein
MSGEEVNLKSTFIHNQIKNQKSLIEDTTKSSLCNIWKRVRNV